MEDGGLEMEPFTTLDLVALAWFIGIWIAYAVAIEWSPYGLTGLNSLMDRYREVWMRRMLPRDNRMVGRQVMAARTHGPALFAPPSPIAVCRPLTLLRSTD